MSRRRAGIVIGLLCAVLVVVWLLVLGIVPAKMPETGSRGVKEVEKKAKEFVESPPEMVQIEPLEKTVRDFMLRRDTVGVSPEEIRKKAQETAVSLSNWLQEQDKIEDKLVYKETGRDPFKAAVVERKATSTTKITSTTSAKKPEPKPVQPPKLVLKGTAQDSTGRLALINDKVLKEGDVIAGARIVKIEFERVVVSYQGQSFVFKVIE